MYVRRLVDNEEGVTQTIGEAFPTPVEAVTAIMVLQPSIQQFSNSALSESRPTLRVTVLLSLFY